MQTSSDSTTQTYRISDLKPHPRNQEIYGDSCSAELLESVQRQGVTGVVVIPDGTIISGHRRVEAARELGITNIDVTVRHDLIRPQDILESLLDFNRQREKTTEQRAREYDGYVEVEQIRAAERQIELAGRSLQRSENLRPNLDEGREGRSDTKAASKAGMKRTSARKALSVVKAADNLKKSGRQEEAKQLIDTLNKSVDKAHKEASAQGLLEVSEPEAPEPIPEKLRLETLILEDKRKLYIAHSATTATFNRTNEMVDWAWWTWNPITGCWHGCDYCYARDIANRFFETKFEPTFHPDRLSAPANTKVPFEASTDPRAKNVFTGSMADLFGKWVPQEWILQVFQQVNNNPQWNYLFLTKFPQRLQEICDVLGGFPDNAWVGTTVDQQHRVRIAESAFRDIKAKVKWLSCEPMLERLTFTSLEMFDWVVIGGQSRSTQTPEFQPEWEWAVNLSLQAKNAGCQVYWKENLLIRPKECPWE